MRRKHMPQRTCVACRQVKPARELMRIVRLPSGGVEFDDTGKKPGRGAYLCPYRTCWELALSSKRLEHALKTNITAEEKEALWQHCKSLPPARSDQLSGHAGPLSDTITKREDAIEFSARPSR